MFKDKAGNFSPWRLIVAIVVLVVILIVLFSCFTVVDAGHTGVVLTFGKVSDVVLEEGLHFKVPFAQNIVQIDNRIVKLEVSTEAFSKDLQTISSVVAINYHINKDSSHSIYKNVGLGYQDVLITPAINEVLKAVTAQYTAVELVSARSTVSVLLDEQLNAKLNDYGVFVNEINIINWDFSSEYIAAIEAKQVAEQNLIKTKTEQEQALVIANTDAQRIEIAAQAEANQIKILADAQAESNRVLSDSLNELLIRYRIVDKWDGALPLVTSDGTTLISLPTGSADTDTTAAPTEKHSCFTERTAFFSGSMSIVGVEPVD